MICSGEMYCQCQCYLVLRFMVMERIKSNAGWYCKKRYFNIFKLFHYQRLRQIMVTLCVKKNNIKFLVSKQQGKEIVRFSKFWLSNHLLPPFLLKFCLSKLAQKDLTWRPKWYVCNKMVWLSYIVGTFILLVVCNTIRLILIECL